MRSWQPSQSIHVIAGTPAGGGQDRVAQAVRRALETLGFEAEVHNIPGRGGGNGWDRLATLGDPHHVAVSSPTLVTNRLLGDGDLDHTGLTPLPMLCTEYMAFVVAADGALHSPEDVLQTLRRGAPPPTVSFATAIGNVNHVAWALVARHAGVVAQDLPIRVFDSARYAVADLVDGGCTLAVVSAASAVQEIEAGSVRPIATSSPRRLAAPYEHVATWEELDVAATIGTWRGLVGPPHLDDSQIAFWDATCARIVESEPWLRALEDHRWTATFLRAAATETMLENQRSEFADSLTALGLASDLEPPGR